MNTPPGMNAPPGKARGHRSVGYLFVAGGCLLLHNAIMIAADALGLSLWVAVLASFVIVASAGYIAHCRLTFGERVSGRGFVRYAGAMTANVPVAYALVWLLRDAAGLPMALAAPASSLMMLAVNYALSHWAIVPASAKTPT